MVDSWCSVHSERPINRPSITVSRHSRADNRCERWKIRPIIPVKNVPPKTIVTDIVRESWVLTMIL